MIKNDILRRIEAYGKQFSNAQQKIATYILENASEIPKMTISELSDVTGASPATIVRFCQTLMVNSFSILKVEIASALSYEKPQTLNIEPGESIEVISNKLLESSYQAMADTVHYLTADLIKTFNDIVDESDVIYTYGVGASYLVAQNISQKWSRVGKIVVCESDLHVLMTRFVKNDLKKTLIVVSNSGKTNEVVIASKIARDNGVKVISMTKLGENPLVTLSDVAIRTVDPNESEFRSAATSSLHVQFLIVDILFFDFISNRYEQSMNYIRETRQHTTHLKV